MKQQQTPRLKTSFLTSRKQSVKATKNREYTNIAPGYVSWVKNVIAPALVEAYLRGKVQAGGTRA